MEEFEGGTRIYWNILLLLQGSKGFIEEIGNWLKLVGINYSHLKWRNTNVIPLFISFSKLSFNRYLLWRASWKYKQGAEKYLTYLWVLYFNICFDSDEKENGFSPVRTLAKFAFWLASYKSHRFPFCGIMHLVNSPTRSVFALFKKLIGVRLMNMMWWLMASFGGFVGSKMLNSRHKLDVHLDKCLAQDAPLCSYWEAVAW